MRENDPRGGSEGKDTHYKHSQRAYWLVECDGTAFIGSKVAGKQPRHDFRGNNSD